MRLALIGYFPITPFQMLNFNQSRGLPKVGMRSARGWHKVCPRSAQGWHEVAQGLPEVGMILALIGYFPITPFQMLNFKQSQGLPEVGTKSARGWQEVGSDWLFPYHPIPNAKFQAITRSARGWHEVCLRLSRGCPRLPEVCLRLARGCLRSVRGWHEVGSDWLFPYHPIPNAKFQPIMRSAQHWHDVCLRLA